MTRRIPTLLLATLAALANTAALAQATPPPAALATPAPPPTSPPPPHAQPQQPSPEQMKQIMQATMGAMVSVMGPMTEAMIEAQLTSAAKPETAERIASFKKNLYDALLKKSFTPEQAMQIVLTTAPPSATPSMK